MKPIISKRFFSLILFSLFLIPGQSMFAYQSGLKENSDKVQNLSFSNELQNDGNFIVRGKILNAPNKLVIIQDLPKSSGKKRVQAKIFDSTRTNMDGTFELKGKALEKTVGAIVIDNQQAAYFILDGLTYTLNADFNNFQQYKLEGSTESKILRSLLDNLTKKSQALKEAQKLKNNGLRQKSDKATMEALKQNENIAIDDLYNFLKDFVDTTSSSLVGLYAIDMLDFNLYYDFATEKYNEYKKQMPNSSYVTKLANKLANFGKYIGKPAPEITMPNPEGVNMSLSDLRGKYVLIDFWAAWCGPCRRENPNVVKLYHKYKDKGFTVFSVSLDKAKSNWVNAIKADGLVWPNHVSELKYWQTSVTKTYNFNSIPTTYLIDKEGNIIARNLRGYSLERKLKEIFGF
jgi:peroxiredoxin